MAQNEVLQDVRLIYRNFKGSVGPYNKTGERSFNLLFSTEDSVVVDHLIKDGWNVKSKENSETGEYYFILEVAVRFDNWPPTIVKIGHLTGKKTTLGEDTVEMLDYLPIRRADVEISPYRWTMNGKSGVKAYLKNLYVVVEESALELYWEEQLASWDDSRPIFND